MKVLVTGGAGFIGHNVALFLKSQDFEVIAFDNLSRATAPALKLLHDQNIPIIRGDVLCTSALKRAMAGVDVAVHAAAYISVKESIKKPGAYFKNNVAGTASFAKACLDSHVKFVIYLSSAAVYGDPKSLPIEESHPTDPISPYGLTKLMGEEILKFYSRLGLEYTTLRLFNVYGIGQSSAYAGVITNFMERVAEGKPPIIYGDGQQTRDFIHVRDVAEAIRLVVERRPSNETFNIASGKPTKIAELALLIIKLNGSELKPKHVKPRPGDIRHSIADISKAQRLLGFKPKWDLERGLSDLVRKI